MLRKRGLSFEQKIFLWELFLVLIINLGTIFKINSISSSAFAFSVVLAMILMYKRIRCFDKYVLMFAVMALLGVVFTGLRNGAMILKFDYYRKYLLALSTVIFFYMASVIPISSKFVRWIKNFSAILALLYVIAFYILGEKTTLAGGITLNFANPNFTAFWLFIAVLFSVYNLSTEDVLILRVFWAFSVVLLVIMVIKTLARSAIMALFIFGIFLLIGGLKKKYQFSNLLIIGIILSPMIFGILYMELVDNERILEAFSFMEGAGKSLLSRSGIWQASLGVLKHNLFFGNYFKATGGTGLSQLHNTHIDLLVSYGLIAFYAFMKGLYYSIRRIIQEVKSFPQYVGICAFFAVIFLGSFEAALVSGGLGANYWIACLLICARHTGLEP